MSAPRLASTTFSSGAQDDLATVDAYTAGASETINSIQDQSSKPSFDTSSLLGNSKTVLGGISSLLQQTKDGVKVNTTELTKRLLKTGTQLTSSYRQLGTDAQSNILSTYKDNGTVLANMGGYVANVKSDNLMDVANLGSFVNDYKGVSGDDAICKFDDTDVKSTILSGAIKEGSSLGMSNVFTTMTQGVEDRTLLTRVVSQSLPVAVQNGDLGLLKEISDSPYAKDVKYMYPSFAQTFAQSYKGSNGYGNTNNTFSDYTKLTVSLTNIASDWNRLERNGGIDGENDIAINLVALMAGSKAFQQLIVDGVRQLTDNSDKQKQNALATIYKKTTVEAEVARCFPALMTTWKMAGNKQNVTNSKRNTVDPRLLLKLGDTVLSGGSA